LMELSGYKDPDRINRIFRMLFAQACSFCQSGQNNPPGQFLHFTTGLVSDFNLLAGQKGLRKASVKS
jgi:hypothetical protein